MPPIHKRFLLTAAAFVSLAANAQTAAGSTSQLPINLQADSGEYDAAAGKATYAGNVVISQGGMNLKGDKVVISIANGQVTAIEAWGNRASFHYTPKGQPPIDGKAQYMKYTIASNTVEMDKNAWVKQDKNETTASHLTYNLKQERIKASRVNMTLIPKTQ